MRYDNLEEIYRGTKVSQLFSQISFTFPILMAYIKVILVNKYFNTY